jgi:hypothetical protein
MAKFKSSKLPIQEVLGVIAGAVAANLVSKAVDKAMPTGSPVVKALIPVAAGVFLATQKNALVKGAGFGMVAKGGSALVDAFLPNMGAIDDIFTMGANDDFMMGDDDFLSLPADQSILSLPADQSILSGMDEDGIMQDELSILSGFDQED